MTAETPIRTDVYKASTKINHRLITMPIQHIVSFAFNPSTSQSTQYEIKNRFFALGKQCQLPKEFGEDAGKKYITQFKAGSQNSEENLHKGFEARLRFYSYKILSNRIVLSKYISSLSRTKRNGGTTLSKIPTMSVSRAGYRNWAF